MFTMRKAMIVPAVALAAALTATSAFAGGLGDAEFEEIDAKQGGISLDLATDPITEDFRSAGG